eukprot:Skav201116  [mRNA]  locus=scaffold185:389587:391725:+ [translate_table: standard]
MACLSIALVSGKTASVEMLLTGTVAALKRRAEEVLGTRLQGLITSTGVVLQDDWATIEDAGLAHGDELTVRWAVAATVAVACAMTAFAAATCRGDVLLWGDHAELPRGPVAVVLEATGKQWLDVVR